VLFTSIRLLESFFKAILEGRAARLYASLSSDSTQLVVASSIERLATVRLTGILLNSTGDASLRDVIYVYRDVLRCIHASESRDY